MKRNDSEKKERKKERKGTIIRMGKGNNEDSSERMRKREKIATKRRREKFGERTEEETKKG